MNRLELAIRRYRQIMPEAIPARRDFPAAELRVWLHEDVGRVVEKLAGLPKFRNYATWSINSLRKNAKTKERRLLDRCVEAICNAKRIMQRSLASTAADHRTTHSEWQAGETVEISSSGIRKIDHEVQNNQKSAQQRERPRPLRPPGCLVNNETPELVNVLDYYQPQNLFLDLSVQTGNLNPHLNPRLRSVGDYIVRAMFERIGTLVTMLIESAKRLPRSRTISDDLGMQLVYKLVEKLRSQCMTEPDWELRDSCVTLVQVYSALHPNSTFDWLGLPENVRADLNILKHRFESLRNIELVERVAAALDSVRAIYVGRATVADQAERLIQRGGLVVLLSRKEVYWECDKLKINGNRQTTIWKLIVTLTKKSRTNGVITHRDLSDSYSLSALATNIYRLKKTLPATLKRHIIDVRNEGYRLDLSREQVHLV